VVTVFEEASHTGGPFTSPLGSVLIDVPPEVPFETIEIDGQHHLHAVEDLHACSHLAGLTRRQMSAMLQARRGKVKVQPLQW